jgi:cell division protein FtsW
MQQGWLTKTFKGDRVIWGLVVLFMFYSLLAVYSSSVGVAFMKYGGNTTYFLRSQFLMLALSLVIIVVIHYLPYRIYFSLAGLFLIVSVGLLILTFAFYPLARNPRNRIQPSDIRCRKGCTGTVPGQIAGQVPE